MGLKQEAIVQEFLAAWGDENRRPDVDRIVAMFAPDASWQLYLPHGPVIRGREALRAEIERQLGYIAWARCGVLNIVSNDHQVITERLDLVNKNGHILHHALMSIHELDGDGLITHWREYFDTWDLARQSGSDPARLSGLEPPAG